MLENANENLLQQAKKDLILFDSDYKMIFVGLKKKNRLNLFLQDLTTPTARLEWEQAVNALEMD